MIFKRVFVLFALCSLANFSYAIELTFKDCAQVYISSPVFKDIVSCGYRGIKSVYYEPKFKDITMLGLHYNRVSELGEIARYKKLKTLLLGNNRLTYLKGLEKLHVLEELFVDGNDLHSIDGICTNKRHLRSVSLSGRFTDLKPLDECQSLESLDISNSQLRTIGDLVNLSNSVDDLRIENSPVVSLSGVKDFVRLRHLYISGTAITSIPSLSRLTELKTVVISGNEDLSDISGLFGIKSARAVSLRGSSKVPCWQLEKLKTTKIGKLLLPETCVR